MFWKKFISVAIILLVASLVFSDAKITEFRGKVEIRSPGEAWRPAGVGMLVSHDDTISTGFGASAVLSLGTNNVIVSPLTRMTLDAFLEKENTVTTNLFLRVGAVRAQVDDSGAKKQTFNITSPYSTASVRGTEFSFDGLNLQVFKGSVALFLGPPVRIRQADIDPPAGGDDGDDGDDDGSGADGEGSDSGSGSDGSGSGGSDGSDGDGSGGDDGSEGDDGSDSEGTGSGSDGADGSGSGSSDTGSTGSSGAGDGGSGSGAGGTGGAGAGAGSGAQSGGIVVGAGQTLQLDIDFSGGGITMPTVTSQPGSDFTTDPSSSGAGGSGGSGSGSGSGGDNSGGGGGSGPNIPQVTTGDVNITWEWEDAE